MKSNFGNYLLYLVICFNSLVFLVYGFAKIFSIQSFHTDAFSHTMVKDMSPTALMWYFHFAKRGYAYLVAVGQIIAALSILSKRTRFIGCLLYFFIITNILAINLFFNITNTTLILSFGLFLGNIIIIVSERSKLLASLK